MFFVFLVYSLVVDIEQMFKSRCYTDMVVYIYQKCEESLKIEIFKLDGGVGRFFKDDVVYIEKMCKGNLQSILFFIYYFCYLYLCVLRCCFLGNVYFFFRDCFMWFILVIIYYMIIILRYLINVFLIQKI